MRRGRIAKATLVELQRRVTLSEKKKQELIAYAYALKDRYSRGKISYSRYVEILHKKRDGKTIKQWVDYYNQYIADCQKLISQQKREVVKSKTQTFLFLFVFASLLITAVYYVDYRYTGFVVEGESEPEAPEDIQPEIEPEVPPSEEDSTPSQDEEPPTEIPEEEPVEEIPEPEVNITDEEIPEPEIETNKTEKDGEEIPDTDINATEGEIPPELEVNETIPEINITKELEATLNPQINITKPPITNITPQINLTKPPITNITIPGINFTEVPNASVETTQFQAVLGQPVIWIKRITLNESTGLKPIKIKLPKDATNISIKKITDIYSEDTTREVSSEEDSTPSQEGPLSSGTEPSFPSGLEPSFPSETTISGEIIQEPTEQVTPEQFAELQKQIEELQKQLDQVSGQLEDVSALIKETKEEDITRRSLITGAVIGTGQKEVSGNFIVRFFKRVFGALTGRVIQTEILQDVIEVTINDSGLEYEITYETPAPQAIERLIPRGKQVKISSPEDIHYTNVLAFTNLDESLNIQNPNSVKIFWVEQNTYLPIQSLQDRDSNGIYDYIEWIAPRLSNQTFNIIVITKAEHLDSNRDFISDIYEEVKAQDNIWSETILDSHYVRVTFEVNLTSEKDITIWPRVTSGNPTIQVYEQNQNTLIAEFTNLNNNEYNKIFLTNLVSQSQDVFDLQVSGGSIEFDHIIDPTDSYWVDNYDGTSTDWTNVGSAPYLGAQDTPTNEITASSANQNHGDFEFPDLPGGATSINSVTLNIYADCGTEKIEIYVWDDGAAAYQVHALGTCGAYSWNSVSLTELTTVAEVNAAKFYVRSKNSGGFTGLVKVDAANLSVDYNAPASDTEYPQFTSLTEVPAEPINYSSGTEYGFNVTVTSTNGTVGLDFNGTNYTVSNISATIFNSTFFDLPAGNFSYRWFAWGNGSSTMFNYSILFDYTVNRIIPYGNLTNDTALTRTYDTTVTAIGSQEGNIGDGDVSYRIIKDGVDMGTSHSEGSVGTHVYILNTTGGQNYTSNLSMNTFTLTININASDINLTLNGIQGNFTVQEDVAIDLNCSTINGDSGAFLLIHNETIEINNGTSPIGNTTTFANAGIFNVTCFYTATNNYTASFETWWVNVTAVTNIAPDNPTVNINSSDATNNSASNLNCSALITDPDSGDLLNVTVRWYNDSFLDLTENYNDNYINGTNFTAILNFANTTAGENWSCGIQVSDNIASSNWVNTTYNLTILNTAPVIQYIYNDTMTDVSTALNQGPVPTGITINFSVYDADGTGSLNHTTAGINFTQSGVIRANSSCSIAAQDTNVINYTCNVTMWWWDDVGTWNIGAFILDNQTNSHTNTSATFQVGSTASFEMSPGSLTWAGISPGQTNLTSSNHPLLLNNTGNKDIAVGEIGINATNLKGEENGAFALWANNFSVGWITGSDAECDYSSTATNMTAGLYKNVSTANMTAGNYTINDGNTGQEQLYFCLSIAGSELQSQSYSTANEGTWTIRILLVALSYRRKRKSKSKKKSKQQTIENLSIPTSIFNNTLGCMEAIVKYMKENLSMDYSEIAKILNRDQRTIWTAYNRAIKKQPEKIQIEETVQVMPAIIKLEKIFLVIPVSIFKNRKLTILEAIITYLKEKGLRFTEIAKLLSRDQRNVRDTYTKAIKKNKQ